MKKLYGVLILSALFCAAFGKPQKVIFDTDIGNDIDDALALLMLLNYHEQGKAELLGVSIVKEGADAAIFTDIILQYYGLPDIPIAITQGSVKSPHNAFMPAAINALSPDGRYLFARRADANTKLPEPVKFIRKILADEKEDGEIILIVVGYSTNIARLLESGADEISPLSGVELVKKKVKFVSAMAGSFDAENLAKVSLATAEWNVLMDAPSARSMYEKCPVPIVFSGYEVGQAVRISHDGLDKSWHSPSANPVKMGYDAFARSADKKNGRYDRQTWDLTSVLYAVEPESPYFTLSPKGDVRVCSDKGAVSFVQNEKSRGDQYLILNNGKIEDLKNYFLELCSMKPVKK